MMQPNHVILLLTKNKDGVVEEWVKAVDEDGNAELWLQNMAVCS